MPSFRYLGTDAPISCTIVKLVVVIQSRFFEGVVALNVNVVSTAEQNHVSLRLCYLGHDEGTVRFLSSKPRNIK